MNCGYSPRNYLLGVCFFSRNMLLQYVLCCPEDAKWRRNRRTKLILSANDGGNIVERNSFKVTSQRIPSITGCKRDFRRTFSSYQAFISTKEDAGWNDGVLPIIVIGIFIDQFSKWTNWSKAGNVKWLYSTLTNNASRVIHLPGLWLICWLWEITGQRVLVGQMDG